MRHLLNNFRTLKIDITSNCSVGLPESIFSDFFTYLANMKPSLGQYACYLKLMWYQVLRGYGALISRGKIIQLVVATNNAAVESISKIQSDGEGKYTQM